MVGRRSTWIVSATFHFWNLNNKNDLERNKHVTARDEHATTYLLFSQCIKLTRRQMRGHVAGTSQKKDKWEINVKFGYQNSLKAVPFYWKQYRKVCKQTRSRTVWVQVCLSTENLIKWVTVTKRKTGHVTSHVTGIWNLTIRTGENICTSAATQ